MKSIVRRLLAAVLSLVLLVTGASALSVEQALNLLGEHYLHSIPEQARQAATLQDLFAQLGDPYTYYMSAEEYERFQSDLDGSQSLIGVGITIRFTEEGILVLETLRGGSAQGAGLIPGDLIVAVDGVSCVPANPEHQALITGPAYTFVTLIILRDGVSFPLTLQRRPISIANTEASLIDQSIGHIECTSFGSDTGTRFANAITLYDSQATHWIVDLRSNSGGYTDSAIAATGAFAGPDFYLFLRNKEGTTHRLVHTSAALTENPVLVLVDSASASASELFAANIRDKSAGLVIGSRTFGKGLAQIVLDQQSHPDLFQGDGLKVTTHRFYSNMGNTTDYIGVIPTLMVDDAVAKEVALALCESFRDNYVTEGQMMLSIADQYFFLDPSALSPTAAAALLAALPPSAKLWVGEDVYYWNEITREQAAELMHTTYESRSFTDVAASPFADEINTLGTYRLLLGDGSGKYLPNGKFTRAQMCAMLAQLLGVTYTGSSRFTDVPDSAWYADEVNAMAYLGFVEGPGNGQFRPNDVLSQQEFFTILGRMARYLNFSVDDYTQSFYDANDTYLLDLRPELDKFAGWAKQEVAVLDGASEVLGRGGSMLFADLSELNPTAPIFRDQAAACLYRMLNLTGILPV